MENGLTVGGAFLSSALNVLFDRLAPHGDLLNMFQKHTDHVWLFKKLKRTLLCLQAVLSDAESKRASNPSVSQWLNELRDAVNSAENLIEEAFRLKVEDQSDEFCCNIKVKVEDTIGTLEVLQEQITDLGLKEHFVSTKQETTTPSTSLVDESESASGEKPTVVPIVGMHGVGRTTLTRKILLRERLTYCHELCEDFFAAKCTI
ncbi:putative disease resistance RPP13-like protein 1 [Solanum stenotomum]|uniref:putative disease resistance RPP13-like protein 1 n=1 Tax=Solanum stenotomum TaxID=172797 RepID=UPI0020D0F41D|nr:putative disease resistance RPP13-like protein 1 [Solanum stenotomum]